MEYLGFWVSSNGLNPISKNIESITDMKLPTYQKEIRQFIDGLNYYRNIGPWF